MNPSSKPRANCIASLLAVTLLGAPTFSHAQNESDPERSEEASAFIAGMKNGEIDCALDPLGSIPGTWALTPDKLDALFEVPEGVNMKKNPYFNWLTTIRDRAQFMRQPYTNLSVDLTLFKETVPVEEVIVDFLDGKLNGITLSIYNRGDASEISTEEFERRKKICGSEMSRQLGVRPRARKANPTQGLLTEGWLWISEKGMAVLEYNPEAETGHPEFLRMRIAPRDTKGAFAAAMRDRASAVKLSDLPRNVVRDSNGDIHIAGIPMVDQGPKGYCVVATCQRLLEYYGIPCDQHQIAQIAGSDADKGTNTLSMSDSLEKIDYRFKTRFTTLLTLVTSGELYEWRRKKPARFQDFEKHVTDYIDDGVPLLWSLELGKYKEDPPIAQQAGGGHMRMITGYNKQERKIVFSDTWGAGHEKKTMDYEDAYKATHGLYVMTPTTR